MITLTFNTTERTVLVQTTYGEQTYINVPTVKPHPDGYYEVQQELTNENGTTKRYPVLRVPIAMTYMEIKK